MFEVGTVFIVGAGGSKELDLPLGEDLMEQIASILWTDRGQFQDHVIQNTVTALAMERVGTNFGNEFSKLSGAAIRVRQALPFAMSIDNLLDAHQTDEDMVIIGKIAITRAILRAERNSNLGAFLTPPEQPNSFSAEMIRKFRKSWYLPLVRLLNSGLSLAEVERIFDNVSFITFNYDRCLEQFLLAGIVRYYNVEHDRARDAIRRLRIVHIYGSVGTIPILGFDNPVHFGEDETDSILSIAKGIQTFTETAQSGLVESSREMITNARTLVFMGFGFLPQNMKVLRVRDPSRATRVFITTTGISDSDVPIIQDEMNALIQKPRTEHEGEGPSFYRLFTERGTCADLMRNHWLRLTRQ